MFSNQQKVIKQYTAIQNSGDKILGGILDILVNSKHKHYIYDMADDKSIIPSTHVKRFDDFALEMFGGGSSTNSYFGFGRNDFSDFGEVAHEMRHQFDSDR